MADGFSSLLTQKPDLASAARMWLWSRNPYAFCVECLGVTPEPWQAKILKAMSQGHTRISIRSGNGVGKTTLLSWLTIWFAVTRYPQKTVVTAPTAQQLFDALWAEVRRWLKACPASIADLFEVTSDRIFLKSDSAASFVSARTSRAEQPEALQGVHSANVMLIVDEASGVAEQVFDAGQGSMSTPGAITVLAGNPLRSSGFFYRTHTDMADRWYSAKVSCFDSKYVDPAFIREMADNYGPASARYAARVLGEFPLHEEDVLLSREMVLAATTREAPNLMRDDYKRAVWGLDVARFGSDATVLIKRLGPVINERPIIWRNVDLMHVVGVVKTEYDALPIDMRPSAICVDAIGLGAGVADRMAEMGLPVLAVNVSESPTTGSQYYRLRDELYCRTRDWFATRQVSVPAHDKLVADLTALKYRYLSDGRIKIESKDEMRKRGLSSPDCADALAMSFYAGNDGPVGFATSFSGGRVGNKLKSDVAWVV
jgi:hypothetical protein